jgi:hypothetical protein
MLGAICLGLIAIPRLTHCRSKAVVTNMTLQVRGVKILSGRSSVASMLGTAIGGILAMHDSLANAPKGNMIDNPDQVERLIAGLRQSLPLFATVTPEVAGIIRERSPTAADPQRRYPITRVDYAGDEGGIVCKVELGPEVGDSALFTSITHLRFGHAEPLARQIAGYQKHRVKRLRRDGQRNQA